MQYETETMSGMSHWSGYKPNDTKTKTHTLIIEKQILNLHQNLQ